MIMGEDQQAWERAWMQHDSGVHVNCPKHVDCDRPGTVDRFHAHDYDGPLVCGCDEERLG